MPSLHFRLPGRPDTLGAWLSRLLPEVDRSERRRWIEEGRVRIDGRVADRGTASCPSGARIEVSDADDVFRPSVPDGTASRWTGLIEEAPWSGGGLEVPEIGEFEFRIEASVRGWSRFRIEGPECAASTIARAMAEAGLPLVGDLERGGRGVPGGLRLAAWPAGDGPSLDWPEDSAWPMESGDEKSLESTARFRVSDETARAIRKGHAWILPDGASDPASHFRPGSLVHVVSRTDEDLGWARIEDDARLAARVWADPGIESRRMASVESRVARALARRRDLLVDVRESGTNAFRLVHGEGDDLPGLFVDRLGPLLRVLVSGRASDLIRARVVEALVNQLPVTPEGDAWSILELLHLRAPRLAQFDRVRWIAGGLETMAESGVEFREGQGESFGVVERGLVYGVDPGWDAPRRVRPGFGLFLDQRENRARLGPHAARGGHWLNLFAHTGAFTASLLAAGAGQVTSVDLSAAYLSRLQANLVANIDRGVDPARNESIRVEGRRYLETLPAESRFDGIVLDPPTAAAAGHRFWSLARDLDPLLRRCVERLAPAGVLLVTQNRRGPALGLDRALERIAERTQRSIAALEAAPAGSDHPVRPGFPEGDPFEGWLLRLD